MTDHPQDAQVVGDREDEGDVADEAAAGAVPHTGDADIDRSLAELEAVRDQPLAEHIAAAERVHRHLQSRLSDLGD
ncbi:MAG TPA: hypothetical protein VFL99_13145 [Segeticoccus sp.]|uniref:hypothetical protein n=1 Tax=Segeticoccus sp. TaxID=2706531 RepID=UPI002D7E89BA|nr:hypothetical protein [Segeticoccus sp.]HET8601268.1 hypothetical protein [Segeticoccus sp.]